MPLGDIYDSVNEELSLLGLFLRGDGSALRIGALGKVHKEISEGEEVPDVDPDSHLSTGRANASRDKEVRDSNSDSNQKLRDLHGGEVLLAWGVEADRSKGIVAVHNSVDERVEDDKNPNRRCLVVDAGPHGDHCASVMVGLKQRRATSLQDDDDGVDDLVELGKVEEVTPVTEGVVPQALIRIAVLLTGETNN